ncbi:MAG: hypothetical protein U1E72_16040 [Burkholderiaceae bacterium]
MGNACDAARTVKDPLIRFCGAAGLFCIGTKPLPVKSILNTPAQAPGVTQAISPAVANTRLDEAFNRALLDAVVSKTRFSHERGRPLMQGVMRTELLRRSALNDLLAVAPMAANAVRP